MDFTIFGVPRSGTTALVVAANFHPRVFCSHEWQIGLHSAHAHLTFPAAFYEGDDLQPDHARRKLDRERLDHKTRDGIPLIYGNKLPTYLWHLDTLHRCFPRARHTVIYRSPLSIMPSWDTRAADVEDTTWHRGQIGLFALFEWLMLLDLLARHPADMLVVSYDAMFVRGAETYVAWMRHLGRRVHDPLLARFRERLILPPGSEQERIASCAHGPFLREIGVEALDAMMGDLGCCTPSSVSSLYSRFVSSRADAIARYVAGELARVQVGAPAVYGRIWAGHLEELLRSQQWRNPDLLSAASRLSAALR